MGRIYAPIEVISSEDLSDARRGRIAAAEVRRIRVDALVDSGAYMLALNEVIVQQLGLPKVDETSAELADGSRVRFDVVGPVEIRFENRRTITQAVVLPGDAEVLLGAIPMEDMDVLIDPKQQRLIVNPLHPFITEKPFK